MSRWPLAALLFLLGAVAPPLADAQTAATNDQARVGQATAVGLNGRVAINQAAGTGNVQANQAAIALAENGYAVFDIRGRQQALAGDRRRSASARIDGGAFADAGGVLSLNQAAGSGNAQLNLFAIGHGDAMPGADLIAGLDDTALAAVAGDNPTEGAGSMPAVRSATIDPDAFRGSRGVVQVNQAAGVGNASINAIVLQLPGGAL